MINEKSIQAVFSSRFSSFCKPLYESYCFSRIPETIQKLLGIPTAQALPSDCCPDITYDNVIFFFLDGFGWKCFEKQKKNFPFLNRFLEKGIVSKLTSQFPSTTVNHITLMHTGLSASETGLYEWFYYEPLVDAPIAPLHFSLARDHQFNTLEQMGYRPEELFPFPTFYEKLKQQGIDSYVFQPEDTVHSPYSRTLLKGSKVHGYSSFPACLDKLQQQYKEPNENRRYFFIYFPDIDGMAHEKGPESPEVEAVVKSALSQLELFWQALNPKGGKTGVIVTADHGFSTVDPHKTVYLNIAFPSCHQYIKKNKKGELIVPCGSSRDFFLHIEEEKLAEFKTFLQRILADVAEVYTTQELIAANLFSLAAPSNAFLNRVGNLVILPHAPYSVWWYEKGRFENLFRGHHGGLSRDEMEIPFLLLNTQ